MVISHIGNMYLEEMSSLHIGFLEVLTGLGNCRLPSGCRPAGRRILPLLERLECTP